MAESSFDPPGAGEWLLDRSHYTGGVTPISTWLMAEAPEAAFRKQFAALGVPAETLAVRMVNGFMYTRLVPLIGGDRHITKTPPSLVLKLVSRLHPEFRRRDKQAAATLADPPWAAAIDEWQQRTRPRIEARNRELQAVDLEALADDRLAQHLADLLAHLRSNYEEHIRLHSFDLGPIGRLTVVGRDWGFSTNQLLGALIGASPSTIAPLAQRAKIRAVVEAAGVRPSTLDDIRAVSPELADEVDRYLDRHGSVLYASYDIDGPTLAERPDVVLATIMTARSPADTSAAADVVAAALREQIPVAERETFDQLLHEARLAMDMRDDNGPVTVEWPAGLLRLAMLEASGRLVAAGKLASPAHVFELDKDELVELVGSGVGPAPSVLADRASRRAAQRELEPPSSLGPPAGPPPLDALPVASATLIRIVNAVTEELGMAGTTGSTSVDGPQEMSGHGIGREPFEGIACTAGSAIEAIEGLEPGQILVTRTTSPAYNLVLSMAGGLVTAEGGPMSHAAVLSRELGLPAVIGATLCLERIADGDLIRIDPVAGTVELI